MTEPLQPLPATTTRPVGLAPGHGQTDATQLPTLAPDTVVFRLVKLANLMTRPFFGQFAKRHALTINEWRSIVVLAAQPDSAAQDISATAGLHPMNISRALIGLRKAGMVVTELPPSEMAHLRERMKPVIAKYSASVGEATVNEIMAELAKARK